MSYQKQWRQQGHGYGGGGGGRGRGGGGNRSGSRGGGGYHGQGSSPSSGSGGSGRDKLALGMRGFLCSCNFNERDCTKEAYNLLNEYFREDEDKVNTGTDDGNDATGGPQLSGEPAAKLEGNEQANDDDDDIEKALNAEVKQLKSFGNRFKFKSADTEVPNLVFISTTVEDPAKLAHRILEDLHAKKEQKSKFLLRMLPIQVVCKAYMDDLEANFRELAPKHFPIGEYTSFQIVFKSRYNGNIHRDDVIKLLADIVVECNSLSVVDLTNPKCTIVVEVIKNKICLGFVKDFGLYKKYNLIEVAAPPAPAPTEAANVSQPAPPGAPAAVGPATETSSTSTQDTA